MSGAIPISSPKKEQSNGLKTYDKAVELAAYDRDMGGLFGKHDNVRRYWEDQLTRYSLHAFLKPFVYTKRKALERVRVIDLGCGSGEGYEILTDLRPEAPSLATKEVDVMPSFLIGTYKGVDISAAMIDKARTIYEGHPKLQFEVADLSNGLPVASEEPPFDIYFSSFGSFSHLKEDEFCRLIVDICDHMGDQALFVADMVGRYSYEWQCYWDGPGEDEDNMHQYSMSYMACE